MKRLYCLIVMLVFVIPMTAFPATLYFKTGFEGAVGINAPGVGTIACQQLWDDSGSPSCINNISNCDGGQVDSETGYNVPYDMPGDVITQGASRRSFFNLVTEGSDNIADIHADAAHSGSLGMRIWNDGSWLQRCNSENYSTGRVQANIYQDSSEAHPHNFDRTVTKMWIKWTEMPTSSYTLFYEWWTYSPNDAQPRLMLRTEGATLYLAYFGGAYSYSLKRFGGQNEISKATWENKWIEQIVYHEIGGGGRCIVWWKLEGEDAVKVMDWPAMKAVGTPSDNEAGGIDVYAPLKQYGSHDKFYTYYDDFSIYSSTGPTDLPEWDGDPPPDPPAGTISAVGPTALASITSFGPSTIASMSAIGPSSLQEEGETPQEMGYATTVGGSGTANLSTSTGRCSRHTSVGAMTVTHGYVYTEDWQEDDGGTVTLAVYSSDGGSPSQPNAQIGDCSSTATVTDNDWHWEQVTFSGTQPAIEATTEYFICEYIVGQIGQYYVTGDSNDEFFEADTTCPGDVDGSGSTRNTVMTVSNYDAH